MDNLDHRPTDGVEDLPFGRRDKPVAHGLDEEKPIQGKYPRLVQRPVG